MQLSKNQKKRAAVWAAFVVVAIAFVFVLVFHLKKTFRPNDIRTQKVDNAKLSPVSQAYDGVEEILGTSVTIKSDKDDDEHATLTFPESISQYTPEKAYTFRTTPLTEFDPQKAIEELKIDGPKVFKAYFGDDYDESNVNLIDDYDRARMLLIKYSDENGNSADFSGGTFGLTSAEYVNYLSNKTPSFDSSDTQIKKYNYEYDPAAAISFPDGEITFSEITEKFIDYFYEKNFSDYIYGCELRPHTAEVTEENGDMQCDIVYELIYDGIPFECDFCSYDERNADTETYYSRLNVSTVMLSSGSYDMISTSSMAFVNNATPVDKIISLKDAVEILKSNLARYIDYKFSDIKLMYCGKQTQHFYNTWLLDEDPEKYTEIVSSDDPNFTEFRPTWYFILENENDADTMTKGIKVDAITGEITMIVE